VKDGVEELSAIVTAPPFVTGSLERAAS
jgi:hypothetical protein